MKIRTVLERVHNLLTDRKHWIKGVSFANSQGEWIQQEKACRFCLDGAIYKSLDNSYLLANSVGTFLDNFCVENKGQGYIDFNDDSKTKHKDVLNLLKKAIGRAKRKGL